MDVVPVIRRTAAPVALVAAATLVLVGCSSSAGGDDGGSEPLTVWFPGTSEPEIDLVTNTLVPQFEEEHDVEVDVTFVDWADLAPKLNSAFAAGTAPDVFGHGPAAAADLVANERVLDLTDYVSTLSEEDRDDLAASLIGGQVDGTQYLIPLSVSGQLVAYRADMLEDAGIDPSSLRTWDDVRAAADELTEKEGDTITRAGLLLGTAAIQRSISFNALISAAGGQLMDGTEVAFDSPEGVAALEFFTELYAGDSAVGNNLGNDYLNSAAAQQPLVTGDAAMTLLTSQAAMQIAAAEPDLEIGVLPALSFMQPAAFGGAGAGLFINADTEATELSWDFIEFMSSPEISTAYAEGTGNIPIRASAAESEYVQSSRVLQAFLAEMPNFVPNPNVPSWTQIRDVLDAQLEQALAGVATPDAALKAAADQAAGIIGG